MDNEGRFEPSRQRIVAPTEPEPLQWSPGPENEQKALF